MIDFKLEHADDHLKTLLARANLSPAGISYLKNAYGGHNRAYHGLYHIAFLWYCHTELAHKYGIPLDDWQRVADAIASHDVIYRARLKTNEIESAKWWRANCQQSKTIYATPMNVEWVAMAIEASANHFLDRPMNTHDEVLLQWFLGLDLMPLAAPWDVFNMNALMIRAEYAHLSQEEWDAGRKAFMSQTLDKPIFRHPFLNSLFETQAKANILRTLGEIG